MDTIYGKAVSIAVPVFLFLIFLELAVERVRRKFDPPRNLALSLYGFVQFALLIAANSQFVALMPKRAGCSTSSTSVYPGQPGDSRRRVREPPGIRIARNRAPGGNRTGRDSGRILVRRPEQPALPSWIRCVPPAFADLAVARRASARPLALVARPVSNPGSPRPHRLQCPCPPW